ncbi:MAG: 4Fe-4S dicluster domain-containing protein [Deltaproteobacteria bacterium]|nr:4Fe-4S dicluster domain-containing protein [Deltaproteobacteria bacterium]
MKRLKGISFPTENGRYANAEIENLPLPERVVLPLVTRFGKMIPIVSPGDHVQAGQIIAKGPQKWFPPLLASVSGRASAVSSWPTGFGDEGPALVIESPEGDTPPPRDDVAQKDLPELMRWIQAGDIREVDPSPLPLALRLRKPDLVPSAFASFSPALEKPIHSLIINGIDRQPGIWLRKAMIGLYKNELLESIPVLKDTTGASRVFFAVAKGTDLADDLLQGLRERGVEPVFCPNIYPIGLEPLLIPFLTGQELPPNSEGGREFGTVVVDVTTALKVRGAARGEIPSLDVVVQITAPSSGIDTLVRVREGTLIEDILEALSLSREGLAKVLCGGPFLGTALHRLDVPVTQEIDSIILQTEQEIIHYSNEPCMNCGYCVLHCPMKLLPNELTKHCEYGKFDVAERMDIFSCIECGICAYVCPVNRPMVQLICFGKREIEAARKES